MADAVAYVLKGYPRMSELFIASEICRLERLGLPLRLYVLKPADEPDHHPLVDQIQAVPDYLPPTTSITSTAVIPWLRDNLRPFLPALRRTLRHHPVRLGLAVATAATQSVRARRGWRPRAIYLKELLLAVELADRVRLSDAVHLHAHFAHGTTTVTWLASMISGLPFSFTGHAKDIYQASLNPAGLLARKLAAADFALTCTAANVDHLRALAPHATVLLAYHGLNADFARLLAAAPVRSPRAAEADTLHVVSVGRFVAKKGFDTLVIAVARLLERGLDVRLTLVGESGDADTAIATAADQHGIADRIAIRGALSQAGLLALYAEADVFALACRVVEDGDRDGIPNVLVEAMAAGLPVVSTTVSGIPELVADGVNGLLVGPNDPDALADALLALAKDPQLHARVAAAGRRTVAERFDGDALAAELIDVFTGRAG